MSKYVNEYYDNLKIKTLEGIEPKYELEEVFEKGSKLDQALALIWYKTENKTIREELGLLAKIILDKDNYCDDKFHIGFVEHNYPAFTGLFKHSSNGIRTCWDSYKKMFPIANNVYKHELIFTEVNPFSGLMYWIRSL